MPALLTEVPMTEDDFDGAQSQPLTQQDGPAVQLQKAIPWTPEELLAWRAYMRANPPLPEKKQIHHSKPWQEPEQWMRRDGAEQ